MGKFSQGDADLVRVKGVFEIFEDRDIQGKITVLH